MVEGGKELVETELVEIELVETELVEIELAETELVEKRRVFFEQDWSVCERLVGWGNRVESFFEGSSAEQEKQSVFSPCCWLLSVGKSVFLEVDKGEFSFAFLSLEREEEEEKRASLLEEVEEETTGD